MRYLVEGEGTYSIVKGCETEEEAALEAARSLSFVFGGDSQNLAVTALAGEATRVRVTRSFEVEGG